MNRTTGKRKTKRENRSTTAATVKKPRQCEHIKVNGDFCGALALRGRRYCFFHLTHIGRRLRAERVHEMALANSWDPSLITAELPLLEDANAVQLALSHIIDAITHNRLDNKRAGLVLYALQTASSNLANGVDFAHRDGATITGRYDDFEDDFQLGDTVPELKADNTHEPEPVALRLTGKREPPPRLERDAPSQRLEVVPAGHLREGKSPVFALLTRQTAHDATE